jgi:hypothetical protein
MGLLRAATSLAQIIDHDWAGRVILRTADLLIEPVLERMQNGRNGLNNTHVSRDRQNRNSMTQLGAELNRLREAWRSGSVERRNTITGHRDLPVKEEALVTPRM